MQLRVQINDVDSGDALEDFDIDCDDIGKDSERIAKLILQYDTESDYGGE